MTHDSPAPLFQEPWTVPSRRPRVAIVGTGMIAAVHRRAAVLAGAELVGVLGSRPERSEQAARRWGLPAAFADLADLARSPVDVVHVCSPNVTHARYVEALLAAGKHVVCEKPLGISLAEAEWMNALAERAGVVATVPFVYRYHPVVREIRARAQAGEYGRWNLLHGHYLQDWLVSPDTSNWRIDPVQGGASRAFADIGSHWCDLVEWVSGERVDTLVAQLSTAVPRRVGPSHGDGDGTSSVATEDTATALFRTTSGVPGSMLVSQVAAGPEEPAVVRAGRIRWQRRVRPGEPRVVLDRDGGAAARSSCGTRTLARPGSGGSATCPQGIRKATGIASPLSWPIPMPPSAVSNPTGCPPSPTACGRPASSRRSSVRPPPPTWTRV